MMAQVLFFDVFSEKDPHLNAVECRLGLIWNAYEQSDPTPFTWWKGVWMQSLSKYLVFTCMVGYVPICNQFQFFSLLVYCLPSRFMKNFVKERLTSLESPETVQTIPKKVIHTLACNYQAVELCKRGNCSWENVQTTCTMFYKYYESSNCLNMCTVLEKIDFDSWKI